MFHLIIVFLFIGVGSARAASSSSDDQGQTAISMVKEMIAGFKITGSVNPGGGQLTIPDTIKKMEQAADESVEETREGLRKRAEAGDGQAAQLRAAMAYRRTGSGWAVLRQDDGFFEVEFWSSGVNVEGPQTKHEFWIVDLGRSRIKPTTPNAFTILTGDAIDEKSLRSRNRRANSGWFQLKKGSDDLWRIVPSAKKAPNEKTAPNK